MKHIIAAILILCSFSTFADENIVIVRHGEKPENGLGQLNCQGLNRALKLPKVLISKYGTPNLILAPNPSILKKDKGVEFAYIRPLATIEPTAIKLSMPVNVTYSFEDYKSVTDLLLNEKNKNSTIFVAWEHHLGARIAQEVLTRVNGQSEHLKWSDDDFDSIYRITIKDGVATFQIEHQELNGLVNQCE